MDATGTRLPTKPPPPDVPRPPVSGGPAVASGGLRPQEGAAAPRRTARPPCGPPSRAPAGRRRWCPAADPGGAGRIATSGHSSAPRPPEPDKPERRPPGAGPGRDRATRRALPLLRAAAALCLAAALAGCTSVPVTRSGFLGDYSRMEPGITGARRLVDRDLVQRAPPGLDLSAYGAVAVEPPTVLAPGLTGTERERLAGVLAEALRAELGKDRAVVDPAAAGPRTLRVRAAVTHAARSSVLLNIAATPLLGPVDNGGAAAEAEALDAATGARVAALSKGGAGVLNLVGYYGELAHARAELRFFARDLAALLRPAPPGGGR